MNMSTGGMCVLMCACVSAAAWASGLGVDGRYVAHGPAVTSEFEAGLYRLNPSYSRGVWPLQDTVKEGIEKDRIPMEQRQTVDVYVKRVVSKRYRPVPDGHVKGVRRIYDKEDAILLWKKMDDGISVEITATTTTLTVTYKSAKVFDWSPQDVTKRSIVRKLRTLLALSEEQLARGQVVVATANVAGTPIARGSVRIASPKDAGAGPMGFRWYNRIDFWTAKGILFVSVVPFEGAVAQPPEIKFGE